MERNIFPIILTSIISILGSVIASFVFPFLKDYLPIIGVMIIIFSGIGIVIYIRINEVNKDLKEKENKLKEFELRIERAESLIDIKAENRYLKDKIFELEKRIEDGSKK